VTRPTASAPHWTEIDWRPFVNDAQVGGRRLRYLDYDPVPGRPALILIHGLSGCWQWWLEVLPALGRRHRIIAVDLPGFGHSDPLPSPGEMTAHAQVVAQLADQLKLDNVTVAGHSMGGLVTLELARTRPALVSSVILVNAGGVPMSEAQLRIVIAFIRASSRVIATPAINRALVRRPRARAILSKVAVGNSDAMSLELAAQVVPLMDAPGYVEAVISAGRAVRTTHPEGVHQPALLLWGEDDPIVTVANARKMERRLPNPTLVLIPGTGHSPFIGKPDAFITAVFDFTETPKEKV
jgi:pimeloyl-ACP methyl ester carboxylesterase